VHLLAEQGLLSLDKPVCEYWPEYGRNGKQNVTVRQILQHRSGAPMMRRGMRSLLGEVWAIPNWAKSIQRIEATTPWYTPGSVPAYQFFSYGFICGELVYRVTGKKIRILHELCSPLGSRGPLSAFRGRRGGSAVIKGRRRLFQLAPHARGSVPVGDDLDDRQRSCSPYECFVAVGVTAAFSPERSNDPAARQPSSDGEVDQFIKAPALVTGVRA
jgi:hypothetical protein